MKMTYSQAGQFIFNLSRKHGVEQVTMKLNY